MVDEKYLVFDTETTGVDVFNDRIVQLVISICDAEGNVLETHEWIIDPGVEVPEGAANVHGFTTEFLRENGTNPRKALGEAFDLFVENDHLTWVAYNLNFDLTILDTEFSRHGIYSLFGEDTVKHVSCFDPLVVDRAKDRFRKGKRTLEAVAPHYGVEFNAEEAHKADYDVEITARVASQVEKMYGIPTTEEQARMHESWAVGLETYLRRNNPDAKVDRGWPLRKKGE